MMYIPITTQNIFVKEMYVQDFKGTPITNEVSYTINALVRENFAVFESTRDSKTLSIAHKQSEGEWFVVTIVDKEDVLGLSTLLGFYSQGKTTRG